jgi:hypothetical protein
MIMAVNKEFEGGISEERPHPASIDAPSGGFLLQEVGDVAGDRGDKCQVEEGSTSDVSRNGRGEGIGLEPCQLEFPSNNNLRSL